MSEIGSFPQVGMKIKNWNHHHPNLRCPKHPFLRQAFQVLRCNRVAFFRLQIHGFLNGWADARAKTVAIVWRKPPNLVWWYIGQQQQQQQNQLSNFQNMTFPILIGS